MTTYIKKDIRLFSVLELENIFVQKNQSKFRATQVHDWLWKKSAHTFSEMSNLSLELRELLEKEFVINGITVADKQVSKDGTIKYGFQLADNFVVEGVMIPTETRTTACISSQVGCSLSCKFCATGKLKRMRNLNHDEIYEQVATIYRDAEEIYKKPLQNIVYMGMGEPLLNYKNVIKSIEMITSKEGLGMSPKRITVSTAGIAKMIKTLADDDVKFNLALSLHAANDKKRDQIMPINEQNTLAALADALKYFYAKTQSRVTYEYIVFKDFNDTLLDAAELANFCKHVPCKVNIIEYNPIDGGEFKQAAREKVDAFAAYLTDRNIVVNVRRSRGKDIDAACGQLANKNKAANNLESKA
jgi:23S rRNA (adenine2503-C2)-methyltransferase